MSWYGWTLEDGTGRSGRSGGTFGTAEEGVQVKVEVISVAVEEVAGKGGRGFGVEGVRSL